MLKISPIKSLAMMSVLAVIAIFAGTGTAYGQCDKVSDAQIVDAIYAKFEANGKLKAHMNHLNVTVVRDAATGSMQAWKTMGWVDTDEERTMIQGAMLQVFYDFGACFKISGMNITQVYLTSSVPDELKSANGCPDSQQACGDICIPKGESCNIKGR
jgi:hypothetical protein